MSNKQNPIKQKQDLLNVQESARRTFNKNILNLINIACEKTPKNDKLQQLKEIFAAIQATEPTIIIVNAGPYIWKYREPIARKEGDFFIKNEFNDDVSEFYQNPEPDQKQDFSTDDINNLMQALKNCWLQLSIAERDIIWRHAGELLKSYAQYVSCEKQLRDITIKIKSLVHA